jgi:hypothetical protein
MLTWIIYSKHFHICDINQKTIAIAVAKKLDRKINELEAVAAKIYISIQV